jgi:hypothetical protein
MPAPHDQPVPPLARLFDGPIDVVGDLCDRGPDSPAVLDFVRDLVGRGVAQCLLGNHELNLLRHERKRGNGWYFDEHPDHARAEFAACRRIGERERDAIRIFVSALPLLLERQDLRIVHAAWDHASVAALLTAAPRSTLDHYREFEAAALEQVPADVAEAARREKVQWREHLHRRDAAVPLLPNLGLQDATYQTANPLRVLTSGLEAPARSAFFASGKWRMVRRVAWWEHYRDPKPVIVGHYWRWLVPGGRERFSRGEPDLFGDARPEQWLGPRERVYCVDFSVGARFRETHDGHAPGTWTRLAALRWPEAELVDEFGGRRAAEPGL